MTRIAVVTPDVLAARMAGPAVRALEVAVQLAAEHDVTLVSTARCDITRPDITCVAAGYRGLRSVLADAQVVIVQGFVTYWAPWLLRSDVVLVVDLYDPLHLEQLEQLNRTDDLPIDDRTALLHLTVRVLNEQLLRGDVFLCANEEQRHLWVGHLAALGRVNPRTYAGDPALAALLRVCPFGLPDAAPVRSARAIKGVVPGIDESDRVVLWAGGVHSWFDPLTLVRAVHRLATERREVRLFFLGMTHPNPDVPESAVVAAVRALSAELGLTGRYVFFNEGWVPYDLRHNYLLDADVGVSTHFEHLETTFSFRTRILDYLWAGLPVICTRGDSFARLVEAEGLGATVPEQDVDALADALERMLYSEAATAARANVARVAPRYTWATVLQPLVEFCRDPRRAADAAADRAALVRHPVLPSSTPLRYLLRAQLLWRRGGPRLVVGRVRSLARKRRG